MNQRSRSSNNNQLFLSLGFILIIMIALMALSFVNQNKTATKVKNAVEQVQVCVTCKSKATGGWGLRICSDSIFTKDNYALRKVKLDRLSYTFSLYMHGRLDRVTTGSRLYSQTIQCSEMIVSYMNKTTINHYKDKFKTTYNASCKHSKHGMIKFEAENKDPIRTDQIVISALGNSWNSLRVITRPKKQKKVHTYTERIVNCEKIFGTTFSIK